MDISGFMQLYSLLVLFMFTFFGEGEPFLGRDVSKNVVRQVLKKRGLSLQQALHQIRDRRAKIRSAQKTPDKKIFDSRSYARVSYQECDLEVSRRLDCGHYGITEEGCAARECCWGETNAQGVPWCYHSKPTIASQCLEDLEERAECGWYGIRKDQCLAKDCCWQPSNEGGVPWCFNAISEPVYPGECGIPAFVPSVLSRVVGGVESRPHSYPWMASLQIDREHFCGGSLINNQWVVTAAHCEPAFWWGDDREVVLGMHNRKVHEASQIRLEIDQIIPHEQYNSPIEYANDIMLLKLKAPVQFTDEISPVCLPEHNTPVQPGKRCYTTGWGHTQTDGELSDVLLQVMVPIIDPDLCGKKGWYADTVDDTMICAGYEEGGRDSCQGDSGGPMVCYDDNAWELTGVVSWGDGCASERKPGIYANVSKYINWIRATVNEYS